MSSINLGPLPVKDSELSFDLHGDSVKEAKARLGEIFNYAEKEQLRQITLITGVGKHSQNNYSVLFRKTVPEFLEQPEIQAKISHVQRHFGGAYEVIFKREDPLLENAHIFKERLAPFLFPNKEFAKIKKSAEDGDKEAQFNLYVRYTEGYGVAKDPQEAVRWLTTAASNGHAYSQTQLGLIHELGMVVPQSFKKALKWHKRAAKQNEPYSLFTLGRYLWLGKGMPKNDPLALDYLSRAAELGEPYAAYNLGAILLQGFDNIPAEPVRAKKLLKQAAKAGNVSAKVLLGKQSFFGWGIPPKDSDARKWFLSVPDDPIAEYYLGRIYGEGRGVPPNSTEAMSWFKKSADHGDLDAQGTVAAYQISGNDFQTGWKKLHELAGGGHRQSAEALGLYYLQGIDQKVPKNRATAIKFLTQAAEKGALDSQKFLASLDPPNSEQWLRKAARQNDPEALFLLGMFLERTGKGSKEEILACYQQSAEQKFAKAVFFLGLSYLEGDIVTKDEAQGLSLIERAAKQQFAPAQCDWGMFLIRSDSDEQHQRAISFFAGAASQNDPEAMFHLAQCYRYGRGIAPSKENYLLWIGKAAALGYSPALFERGCASIDEGKEKEAHNDFLEAAKRGHKVSMRNVAIHYLKVEQNTQEAIRWLKAYVEKERAPHEEFILGLLYIDLNVKLAIHWLTQALMHGHEHAANSLAHLPNAKEPTIVALKRAAAQNHHFAVRALLYLALEEELELEETLLEKAAESDPLLLGEVYHKRQRYAEAKTVLNRFIPTCEDSEMLYRASGLYLRLNDEKGAIAVLERAKNHAEATMLLARLLGKQGEAEPERLFAVWLNAANFDFIDAIYFVGMSYQEGVGTEKDPKEACKWFQKGVQRGDPRCQTDLACLLLANGEQKEAFRLLSQAVGQNFGPAEYTLGQLILSVDPIAGMNLLERAARHGIGEAEEMLHELRRPQGRKEEEPLEEEELPEDDGQPVFEEAEEPKEAAPQKGTGSCAVL